MTAQHSAAMATWYTPEQYVEAARKVLGTIDLDPASDANGNQIVKAARYFSSGGETDCSWGHGVSVWLNPPGPVKGKGAAAMPYPKLFWQRLLRHRDAGHLMHAIVAAFSIEQLQTSQNWGGVAMTAFPVCIPRKRVSWNPPAGMKANSPTHASAFVYVPGLVNATAAFFDVFSEFGAVI